MKKLVTLALALVFLACICVPSLAGSVSYSGTVAYAGQYMNTGATTRTANATTASNAVTSKSPTTATTLYSTVRLNGAQNKLVANTIITSPTISYTNTGTYSMNYMNSVRSDNYTYSVYMRIASDSGNLTTPTTTAGTFNSK